MFKLLQNELMKIFVRPGTYVMLGLLILMVSLEAGILKYQENNIENGTSQNWKQALQTEIKEEKQELKDMADAPKNQIVYLERDVALKEYRIEHNISPNVEYSVWGFVGDTANMIQFAGLFVIIIAAGIVASEFNWGTIKLLLIRPIDRGKILVSKYMAVILFAFMLLSVLFVYSSLLGVLVFGTPEFSIPYLNYVDGKITEQSMALHLVIFYAMKSINMIMLATMAFMMSAVFRNSSLAIGLSIFLMFVGGQLTSLLAMKFAWAKYILFANTDLMQYFEGTPMVEGMTLTFSVMMIVVYFVFFQILAFAIFKKRDVAA